MSKAFNIGPCRAYPHVRDGDPTGKWMVAVPATLGGKRVRKLFETCIEARKFAGGLDRAYRRGEFIPKEEPVRSAYSFAELVELWLKREDDRVETRKKKRVSVETDRYRLKSLLAYFGDDEVSSMTESRVLGYQKHRLKEKRSPATINSDIVTMKKVLRWGHKVGLVSAIPDLAEPIPEDPREVHIPSRDEVVKIIKALPPRLQTVVRFLAETGCRSGEAFHLTWDCMDEVNGFVEFKPKDGWTPKTRSSIRRIPLSEEMLAEIRRLPKTTVYVFTGRYGSRLTCLKKAFATAVKKAGITYRGVPVRITPHVLRKAYATWAATEWGVSQSVLQAQLGHARGSTVTNRYYVHVNDEARKKAVLPLPM